MSESTISSTVTSTVTLGKSPYGDVLSLTSTGKISASTYGVIGPASVTNAEIFNSGEIVGTADYGITLSAGGTVDNLGTSSFIEGGIYGIEATGGLLNVLNQGTITTTRAEAQAYDYYGISVGDGATLTVDNEGSAALITGIFGSSSSTMQIINGGVISDGEEGMYFYLDGATSVDNAGTISGGTDGIYDGVTVLTLNNTGILTGTSAGILVASSDATIINSGTITSADEGIDSYVGTVTVYDSGLISGGTDAIYRFEGNTALILSAGASFSGAVIGATSYTNIIEFASSSTAGSLDMAGTFTNFGTLLFDAGADWSLAATASELANGETISGFAARDTLILEGFTASSEIYAAGKLTLSNDSTTETINLAGSFSAGDITFTDTSQGTQIAVCYLKGTQVMTAAGEMAIEQLKIGDQLPTRFGGMRAVKWIGVQRFSDEFATLTPDVQPVRFATNCFGPGLPKRDLLVTGGHSMLIDGKLVLARHLINGVTVTKASVRAGIEYHQVEFETHDCILAEGVWSESYADTGTLRAKFLNARSFYDAYPHHVAPAEPELCAKRHLAGQNLDRVILPLLKASCIAQVPGPLYGCLDSVEEDLVRGWAWDAGNSATPVIMELIADGKVVAETVALHERADVAAAGYGDGNSGFRFEITVPLGCDVFVRRQGSTTIFRAGRALAGVS